MVARHRDRDGCALVALGCVQPPRRARRPVVRRPVEHGDGARLRLAGIEAVTEERRRQIFLLVVAAIFLPLFAIPLFIDPYWWAERFGWDTGPETDLGNYL